MNELIDGGVYEDDYGNIVMIYNGPFEYQRQVIEHKGSRSIESLEVNSFENNSEYGKSLKYLPAYNTPLAKALRGSNE